MKTLILPTATLSSANLSNDRVDKAYVFANLFLSNPIIPVKPQISNLLKMNQRSIWGDRPMIGAVLTPINFVKSFMRLQFPVFSSFRPVMQKSISALLVLLVVLVFSSCNTKQSADALFYNGTIYTVDSAFNKTTALVIKDGKVLFTGTEAEARKNYEAKQNIDLQGKFLYPGFIDAHCHFYGYAVDLVKADLTGTSSWQQALEKLQQHAAVHPDGWLLGRGWDQNDWPQKEFPTRKELDRLFPDRPVFVMRIDGHAAIANKTALKLAGITANTRVSGGEIKMDFVPGGEMDWLEPEVQKEIKHMGYPPAVPTGLLLDNAMELVQKIIPPVSDDEAAKLLAQAELNCFAVGLTTVSDAGLIKENIFLLDTLQKQGKLNMRVYAMAGDSTPTKQYYLNHGPYKTDKLHVCSFKYYADGALGSRGACLKQPYSDAKTSGLLLSSEEYFRQEAAICLQYGFQMNTHCIGDSAVALMLKIYGEVLKGKNDKRWRIEHCQVVAPEDFNLFGRFSIVPSVQPTHATSDMYWVGDRLGSERLKGAYAYKQLMEQNGSVANGSDFPVEDINPLYGFYAAVKRMDKKGFPEGGFQKENALTCEQALRGMTIWAARANFEEGEKGSLEPGKFADFVITDNDLMQAPDSTLFKIKILQTWLGGKKVYGN